jgi:hypothetical protein
MQSTALSPDSSPTPTAPSTIAGKSSVPCPPPDAALALPEAVQTGQDLFPRLLSEWRDLRRILTLDLLALTDSIRTRRAHD